MSHKLVWLNVKSAREAQKIAQDLDKKGPAYKEPAKMARQMRDQRIADARYAKKTWI